MHIQNSVLDSDSSGRSRQAFWASDLMVAGLLVLGLNGQVLASPVLTYNGFGSLGGVYSDENEADFVANSLVQPDGAGYTDDWHFGVDTRLGGQVNAQFSEKLSGVLQVVSQRHYDNSWRPEVEWANLKYQFNDDISVRIGRTVAAAFMVSDTRLVGYANLWVRPPVELYAMVPITNIDGIDGSFKTRFGEALNTTQLAFGRNSFKTPNDVKIEAKNAWIFSNTLEVGRAIFRLGYIAVDVDLKSSGLQMLIGGYDALGDTLSLFPGLEPAATQAHGLARRYEGEGKALEIYSAGLRYEPDEWLLLAEWGEISDFSVFPKTDAWYVTVGRRMGSFTPYITHARVNSDSPDDGLSTAGLPEPLATGGAMLNAGLEAVLTQGVTSQKSVSLGVRWDMLSSVALKAQVQRIDIDAESGGRLVNIQPGFEPGGEVNLFSLALDFVF